MNFSAGIGSDPTVEDVTFRVTPDRVDSGRLYKTALVFGLPQTLENQIRELRARIHSQFPLAPQVVPHLTLLFIGRPTGRELLPLREALAPLSRSSLSIQLTDIGFFTTSAGRRNIHVGVASTQQLATMHDRAIKACRDIGWLPQTRYLQDRFVPHLTICNQSMVSADAVAELLDDFASPVGAIQLSDPYLLAKPLRP